jgi:hypothetical protein
LNARGGTTAVATEQADSVLANAVARASICVQRRGCAPPLRDEVRAQVAAGSVQFALDANPA